MFNIKRLMTRSAIAVTMGFALCAGGCGTQQDAAMAPPDDEALQTAEQFPVEETVREAYRDPEIALRESTDLPIKLRAPDAIMEEFSPDDEPEMVRSADPQELQQPLETAAPSVRSLRLPPVGESFLPSTELDLQPAAPEATMALRASEPEVPEPHRVQVFYATDRQSASATLQSYAIRAYAPAAAAGLVTLLLMLAMVFLRRRVVWGVLGLAAGLATVQFFHIGNIDAQKQRRLSAESGQIYGNDRNLSSEDPLELGICEVTIPPDHRVGKIESPSIVRLEFSESNEKHVVLERVSHCDAMEFYTELRSQIGQSQAKQAFVFVHGYNVDFEGAVKRTAQIAHDLRFDGAPICYSWPSKGGLAEYTRDEANVTWTVIHLEAFLNSIVQESGAHTIHLVAHSMGNRALVQALERMALQKLDQQPTFGQVVLAAPDVDASEFRNRYAPAITRMAQQVTLYASSNDNALVASTKVHGHTRAGLSGDALVVIPGIDTIDVSHIDTSLLGHSYYGNNPQMIRDMQALVELSRPAADRPWLAQILAKTGTAYWVFREQLEASGTQVERIGVMPGGASTLPSR